MIQRTQERRQVVLNASVRTHVGKQSSKHLRRQGKIPAIVYRKGEPSLPIVVEERELARVLRTEAGENVLITLRFGEGDREHLRKHPILSDGTGVVLIKEIQFHPVSHRMIHVDFHHLSLTERTRVTVPLALKGEAPGVKQEGGILEHLRWELEVECLPTQIPHEIAVDLSSLRIGQTICVKDLTLPEGVKAVADLDQPLISCVAPKVEASAPTGLEAQGVVEPEVIKQKKPEEIQQVEGSEAKEAGRKTERAEEKKG
jgi:large subunit ribosomal protein L25